MDDSGIVKLYLDRSDDAISETNEKYGKYCHYIAYNVLRDEESARECVNDVYLCAWESIPPAKPENLRTYLGRITRNLALNRLEKESAVKRGEGRPPAPYDELDGLLADESARDDPAGDVALKDALDRFLSALPELTRRVFVRRYWYFCPIKEIAEEFGISQSKAAVTLFRTREKLKKYLQKEGIGI